LAVVIWQLIYRKLPFNVENPIEEPSEAVADIRKQLQSQEKPGNLEDIPEAPGLVQLVAECWNRDPLLRPAASNIAENLLIWLVRLSLHGHQGTDENITRQLASGQDDFQSRAMMAIKAAR
jgi:hypothetical protein